MDVRVQLLLLLIVGGQRWRGVSRYGDDRVDLAAHYFDVVDPKSMAWIMVKAVVFKDDAWASSSSRCG
jgi:hypothetical protein